uniref:p64 n=1 Tax=Carnation necrotic fleck virus TaxID=551454 RepID=A0A4P2X5T2_9CLOS|nr:p64 [Carnation necrotic fleck virus]
MDLMLNKVITYLSASDLLFKEKRDNPLLVGLIYDYVITHKAYLSSYARNILVFRDFLDHFMPVVSETWEFKWLSTPIDYRLLFDFKLTSANDIKLPILNVNDMSVVIGNSVKLIERVIDEDDIPLLESHLRAALAEDNPQIDPTVLWRCFHVYYAIYRTAKERVVPRPRVFTPPERVFVGTVNMGRVEDIFDRLQHAYPMYSVRRQFCGKVSTEAINLFKTLGLRFPNLAGVFVPNEYGYLNVDYYKNLPFGELSVEERLVVSSLYKGVDEYCTEQKVNIEAKNAKRLPLTFVNFKAFRDVRPQRRSPNDLEKLGRRIKRAGYRGTQ